MIIVVYLVILVAAFFFLIVLPQRRRMQAHQALMAALQVGDDVITTAGIHGTVRELDGETVRLEIAPGVVVTVARGAIQHVVDTSFDPADGEADGEAI